MAWIGKRVEKRESVYDILKSVAIFSMIEGAILYSSFAFIKHFQNQGKNKLINVNAGINFSAQDEDIHAQGGAWLFNQLLKEVSNSKELFKIFNTFGDDLSKELIHTANTIYEHECHIIDKIFEYGSIAGTTDNQLKLFTQSRLDLCLVRIGLRPIYKPSYNPIAEWFYNNLNSSILHDTFVKQGSDYNRNWIEKNFVW